VNSVFYCDASGRLPSYCYSLVECKAKQHDADGDCLIVGLRTGRRCGDDAVLFVGHVSTVVVTVTDPRCWDTAAPVGTLELVVTARCQHTSYNTRTLSTLWVDLLYNCTSKAIKSERQEFGNLYQSGACEQSEIKVNQRALLAASPNACRPIAPTDTHSDSSTHSA